VTKLGDLRFGELHHVFDAATQVDKAQAVVLQPQRGERGKLLDGRLVVCRFVAETGEHNLWAIGHDENPG
jgi:hypothetical protein